LYDLVSSSELLTMKIKSFTLLLFLLFVSCGSESETTTVETVEAPQELQQVSNSTTTTEVDLNKLGDEFIEYYLANEIGGYINLTQAETEKTYNLHMKYPTIFFWNDFTCYKNDVGMTQTALLDEFFPVYYQNKYYFNQDYTVKDSDGKEYVFQLDDGYRCKLTYDNSENPEYVSLYGRPFYQNDKWWIFEEKEFEPIPVATPGYYANWATRVELNDFEKVYKEWVSDSIPPNIVFENCPELPIDEKEYNLRWGIVSGNADIDYLRIAFWKNGEYYTRVYFEKENHSDIFPFPLAKTETYFEQPVVKPEEEGEIVIEVFFTIRDDYGNSADESCVVTFEK